MLKNIQIIPISKRFNLKSFDCGVEELNRYLRQFAIPNDRKNIGKTFTVFIDNSKNISGYYTISMAQILFNDLPEDLKKGLPRYPVQAMRIGKLAVDKNYQGRNLGAYLLRDAFLRSVKISAEIAVKFIIVDALNDSSKSFYERYGFVATKKSPLTLLISIDTIKKAII